MLTKSELVQWLQLPATKHYFQQLRDAEQYIKDEIGNIPVDSEFTQNKYYYLQGKMHGIFLAIDEEIDLNENVSDSESDR